LRPEDRVKFFVHPDGSVVLLPKLPACSLRDIVKSPRRKVTLEAMNEAAMVALKEGRGSFADALIGALGARAGCSRTLTFDQKALGFRASRRREGSSLAGAPVLAWHRHRLACSTSVLLLHQSPSRSSLALCTH
jgi:hypothetical protein